MTPSDLIEGIRARLAGTAGLAGVTILVEDPENLDEQIKDALGKFGMLILIAQPKWKNLKAENQAAEMQLITEIAIGEVPSVWRGKFDLVIAPDSFVQGGNGNYVATWNGLTIGSQYHWTPGANEIPEVGGPGTLDALGGENIFTAEAALATATSTPAGVFTGSLALVDGGSNKPVCMDVAWLATTRLQGFKAASGFRYLSVHQGDPVPDKKRQLFQLMVESKAIVSPST